MIKLIKDIDNIEKKLEKVLQLVKQENINEILMNPENVKFKDVIDTLPYTVFHKEYELGEELKLRIRRYSYNSYCTVHILYEEKTVNCNTEDMSVENLLEQIEQEFIKKTI